MTRPTIRRGDTGSLVEEVQMCLLKPGDVDGDFGPQTDQAVRDYQEGKELSVDGVVGPMTWAALEQDYELPSYPPGLLSELDDATIKKITDLAMASPVASYQWKDRGASPAGYVKGMALAYVTLLRKFANDDTAVLHMAQADTGDTDKDALAWYTEQYEELDLDNSADGIATLRHLFVLLWGLGMRESSGRHCEGRDQSASNTTSTTAEAGLFQQSWNSASCSTEMQKLLDLYAPNIGSQQCALDAFEQNVECSSGDWGCYGSGDGLLFQETAKKCPQLAVECCGIGLRYLRQHWGPINRHEVELHPDLDALLKQIEEALGAPPETVAPPEPPEPVVPEPPQPEQPPPATSISIVISSGHGQHVRGASGYVDEVNEARRVVDEVARLMRSAGAAVVVFHDNTSTSQNTNLNTIVAQHNKHSRDLDVSVHFNAYQTTSKPMGTEVLYVSQEALARKVSAAIAAAGGFLDRGPKKRTDLAFLNGTNEPAILIETCFVDSGDDTSKYLERFPAICKAIADALGAADV